MIIKAEKTYIFRHNPEAPSCHASTLLPLPDGRILTAWFAGEREGADDVGIWTSVLENGTWSAPKRVTPEMGTAHWNPVLHLKKDGTIVLFYKFGPNVSSWITKFVTSRDGKNWSAPKELVPGDDFGGRGPVKNKCLRLSDGRLLAPASIEPTKEDWIPFIDISEDDGGTWEKCPLMQRPEYEGSPVGMIQPTLWEDEKGVHCLLRSNKGAVYRSDSPDGRIWDMPFRTALPNNNSGLDLDKDGAGRLWLVYNPVTENWGRRYPLTLAVSIDGGDNFTDVFSPEVNEGEYSYPAVIADGNTLFITYTHNRERIAFWKITLE
ncbi:MAG: exo-alpha-sialidase [Oscillospiraceae bacterium]|nr:exo-alpha-sialidase [Oscillospiraceae bacterium]